MRLGTIIVIGIKVTPPAERLPWALGLFPNYIDSSLNLSNAFIADLYGDPRFETEAVRPQLVYQISVHLIIHCFADCSTTEVRKQILLPVGSSLCPFFQRPAEVVLLHRDSF